MLFSSCLGRAASGSNSNEAPLPEALSTTFPHTVQEETFPIITTTTDNGFKTTHAVYGDGTETTFTIWPSGKETTDTVYPDGTSNVKTKTSDTVEIEYSDGTHKCHNRFMTCIYYPNGLCFLKEINHGVNSPAFSIKLTPESAPLYCIRIIDLIHHVIIESPLNKAGCINIELRTGLISVRQDSESINEQHFWPDQTVQNADGTSTYTYENCPIQTITTAPNPSTFVVTFCDAPERDNSSPYANLKSLAYNLIDNLTLTFPQTTLHFDDKDLLT